MKRTISVRIHHNRLYTLQLDVDDRFTLRTPDIPAIEDVPCKFKHSRILSAFVEFYSPFSPYAYTFHVDEAEKFHARRTRRGEEKVYTALIDNQPAVRPATLSFKRPCSRGCCIINFLRPEARLYIERVFYWLFREPRSKILHRCRSFTY